MLKNKRWIAELGQFGSRACAQWGAFYFFIADFFATEIKDGAKELVIPLWLSGDYLIKTMN